MEIKRTTEILVETNRRFVIRRAEESGEQLFCSRCGEPMLAAEQAASLIGISCRAVYRHIENGNIHFAEIETGAVMICISSLASACDDERGKESFGEIFGQITDSAAKNSAGEEGEL
ncbi:MAG TPA: hypothetical protein VF596_04575 [Pyrinomonadaceae bacterium]|jgi:hypothetical protein